MLWKCAVSLLDDSFALYLIERELIKMGKGGSKPCIFCQICNKENLSTRILAENDLIVIFSDIHPAAEKHYLIVPKEHIHNPKSLYNQEHITLVEDLVEFGTKYLQEQNGDVKDAKFGFHWPPFTSVNHLHLHVIHPASSMSLLQRTIFHSSVFASPDYVVDYIKAKL